MVIMIFPYGNTSIPILELFQYGNFAIPILYFKSGIMMAIVVIWIYENTISICSDTVLCDVHCGEWL